ncbi:pre-rRNA processing protein [Ptychographa xylographoides]|nr:pre-rRNA processing protein [Ptychographa xylographoides]
MSSFFTVPASQRKRKRDDVPSNLAAKKRSTSNTATRVQSATQTKKPQRDESISGSDSEEEGVSRQDIGHHDDSESSSSESEHGDETGAEKRLRLAERYLEGIRGEVEETGFDAEQIDKDLIAERLKEDVAETKGRLYRKLASEYAFEQATKTHFRADTQTTTSVATCPPYAYTVSKDLTLIKWKLPDPDSTSPTSSKAKKPPSPCRRPKQLIFTRGDSHRAKDFTYQHHTSRILTVAASSDGRFVATGGVDRRLIVWNAADLTPLRVFTQHRDAITGLAFRRGTNQLYSSSKDRTIKSWSLNELAYVETLFGHQDEVVDVAALAQERCLSVGARDRTVRLWKVVEETQLVFRGGGGGGEKKARNQSREGVTSFAEGSIDRVAMIDEEMFITGSDNGSLSLWTMQKKKPLHTIHLAHGLDPALNPDEAYADERPNPMVPSPPQPRWITALATVPYSDLIVSGSWDGWLRVWKISDDKRRIEAVGTIGQASEMEVTNGHLAAAHETNEGAGEGRAIVGVVNDISIFERGDKGADRLCVVAATGKEHRLGRWKKHPGKNGAVILEVSRKMQ